MNSYFAVICKCGHVGRNNYILITFPVIAANRKEAARIARNIPRCKRHHKDCIREVAEISYEVFLQIKSKNDNDPYLFCKCIQEQRCYDLSNRIIPENKQPLKDKEESIRSVYFGKNKIKYPKKYFRLYAQKETSTDLYYYIE